MIFFRIPFLQIFPLLGMVLFFWVLNLVQNHFVLLILVAELRKFQTSFLCSMILKTLRWKVSCCARVSSSLNFSFLYKTVLQVTSGWLPLLTFPCMRLYQTWLVLPCITDLDERLLCQSQLVVLVFVKQLFMPQWLTSAPTSSTDLIIGIFNCVTPSSPYLFSAVELLSVSANRSEWSYLDNIDFPIRQHLLSRVVDQVSFNILTDIASDTQSKALALSSSVHHGGDWLKVVPLKVLGFHVQDCDFWLCL